MFKSRDQQLSDKGFVFCPNHPTIFYDPKKYKYCFHCFAKEHPEKVETVTKKLKGGVQDE